MGAHRLYGDPLYVINGDLRLGTGDLTSHPLGDIAGTLHVLNGGNSTKGELLLYSKTAGGAVKTTTIYNPITQTVSFDLVLPVGLPGGAHYVLCSVGNTSPLQLEWVNPSTIGVTDHGALTGLGDDDHTIYAKLGGRSGGQTLKGGTDSGDDLYLSSTDHGTKGSIIINDGTVITMSGSIPANGLIEVTNPSTTDYSSGIEGTATGATGKTRGVMGAVNSSDNDAYGGHFDRIHASVHVDLGELSAHPVTPTTGGSGRLHVQDGTVNAWEDHKVFLTDNAGNMHDLTCQHKQCWSGADIASSVKGDGLGEWIAQNGADIKATVTAASSGSFDFTNNQWDTLYGSWTWTAFDGPGIPPVYDVTQSDLAIGVPFRKFGDGSDRAGNCRIIVKARVYLSNSLHFSSVKLFVSDASADNSSVAVGSDFKASASGAWYEATLSTTGTDIGSWTSNLRAGVIAVGTDSPPLGAGYSTEVRLDWLSVEQWVE